MVQIQKIRSRQYRCFILRFMVWYLLTFAQQIYAQADPNNPQSSPPQPIQNTQNNQSSMESVLQKSVSAIDADLGRLVSHAKQKIMHGEAQNAFEILSKEEMKGAGILGFDYVFGVAALESGHQSIAIMVLQRAIDAEPDFGSARFQLAKAFYQVGDNEQAKYHFSVLKKQTLPEKVSNQVDQYLKSIQIRAAKYQTQKRAYLALGVGYDSNANASTSDEFFLSFPLNDENQKQSSPFYELELGGHFSQPITFNSQWYVDGRLNQRENPSIHLVDQTGFNFGLGYKYNWSDKVLDVKIGYLYQLLDDSYNRDSPSLQLSYFQPINSVVNFKVNLNASQQRFQSDIDIRDVDQFSTSLGLEHHPEKSQYSMGFFVVYGEDDATNSISPYGNNKLGLQWIYKKAFNEKFLMTAALGHLNVDYDGDVPFFGGHRKDHQNIGMVSLYWLDVPGKNWQIKSQFSYLDNSSNVALFDFQRLEAVLSVQKSFE